MFQNIKISLFISVYLLIVYLNACNNSSTEPETLYEAKDRYSNSFGFSPLINKIVITNPIGYTFLYGNTDTTRVKYVIDRNVKAKTKSLAESELKNRFGTYCI